MSSKAFGTIISGNQGRNDELSTEQRSAILTLHAAGKLSTEIADVMRCLRQTVTRTVRRFNEHNNTVSRPRSGHLEVLLDRGKNHILQIVRRNPKITYRDAMRQAGLFP